MPKSKKKKGGTKLDRAAGLIAITLGGETRSVKVLSIRDSLAFRQATAAPMFEPLAEIILKFRQSTEVEKAVADIGPGATAKKKKEAVGKAGEKMIANILPKIMPWALGEGLSCLVELPYQYAPELEDLRDKATDTEEIVAGSVVLSLFLPLFMVLLMELPSIISCMEDDID